MLHRSERFQGHAAAQLQRSGSEGASVVVRIIVDVWLSHERIYISVNVLNQVVGIIVHYSLCHYSAVRYRESLVYHIINILVVLVLAEYSQQGIPIIVGDKTIRQELQELSITHGHEVSWCSPSQLFAHAGYLTTARSHQSSLRRKVYQSVRRHKRRFFITYFS